MRVYEFAKILNCTSKNILNKFKEIDINLKNHMSIIKDEDLLKFCNHTNTNIKYIMNELTN